MNVSKILHESTVRRNLSWSFSKAIEENAECYFKLLVKKDDIVIAIVYMYPDGRFFGADDTLRKPISVWIEKTRKNLNK